MANKSKKIAKKSSVNKVADNMANKKTACEEGFSGNLKKKKNVTLSRKLKGKFGGNKTSNVHHLIRLVQVEVFDHHFGKRSNYQSLTHPLSFVQQQPSDKQG